MSQAVAVRPWLPPNVADRVRDVSASALTGAALQAEIERLADENHRIHDVTCLNLNPATNVMNPRAEALLSANLGSRASLGYPGEKYETGLEAIEQIEVLAADAACRVFGATYAEVRVGSGALGNLYSFMATCQPGRYDHRPARHHRWARDPPPRWCRRSVRPEHGGRPRRPGRLHR